MLVVLALAALLLTLNHGPASAHDETEVVEAAVITEHRVSGPTGPGEPRGPELAKDQASLEVLWDDYGFTETGGGAGSESPPPPAPLVRFGRYVAVALSTTGGRPTVVRSSDALIFDTTSGGADPSTATDGEAGVTVFWLLAIDRDDLPASPFRLVERSDGVVHHESTVSVTLPRTGVPVVAAITAAIMLARTGSALVARGGRHRRDAHAT